jgi:hypothetical protein
VHTLQIAFIRDLISRQDWPNPSSKVVSQKRYGEGAQPAYSSPDYSADTKEMHILPLTVSWGERSPEWLLE